MFSGFMDSLLLYVMMLHLLSDALVSSSLHPQYFCNISAKSGELLKMVTFELLKTHGMFN